MDLGRNENDQVGFIAMISVIIPLYNKRTSIKMTIDSVLGQTYEDYEVIVVDDGSTDGSADVVAGFNDSRIRLITKGNGGVSSARNEGVKNAKSQYVAFLDADDFWLPDYLKEISQMIYDYPDACLWGTAFIYRHDGFDLSPNRPVSPEFYGIIDNNDWSKGQLFWTSAVCCKKSALEEVGMFDGRIAYGEDIDVWWRIMLKYPAAFSNKELAVYRFDADNRAMNKRIPLEKLYVNYFEKYAEARKTNDAFRHFIDKECMWWLYPYCLENPKDESVERILSQIDLSEYKLSFRFRFRFPKLYSLLKRL